MGRFNRDSVRGPGTVFLVPIIDRGVRVSLLPQHYRLDALPVAASDGAGLLVDVEVDFTVVDAFEFVFDLIPPPAGLRGVVRGGLRSVLEGMPGGAAHFPGDIEAAVAPLVEERLARAGVRDVVVRVTGVRGGSIEGADEAEFQALLRQEGMAGSYRRPK